MHTISNKRKTFCGTADYVAPEMLSHIDHGKEVDLWCVGVLAYELSAGFTPFGS